MRLLKGEQNLLTYRSQEGHKKPVGKHGKSLLQLSACGDSTDLVALMHEEETLRKEEMQDVGVGRTV